MRVAPLVVMAVLAFSIPALSAEEVPPDVVKQIRQAALEADRKAATPQPKKTPEQVAAEKTAIKNHCEAFFARVTERDDQAQGSCE